MHAPSLPFSLITLLILLLNGCGSGSDGTTSSTTGTTTADTTNTTTNTTARAPTASLLATVSGVGEEAHGHFILTTSDGGFLQVGETGIYPTNAQLFVAKINASGTELWKKTFSDGTGSNLGNGAIEVTDGYVITGAINQNSVVLKLDKNTGETLFNRQSNQGGNDAFEHIVALENGTPAPAYAAVGYAHAQDASNTFYTEGQGLLAFLDSSGAVLSTQSLNAYQSQAYRIALYDSHLIIAGLTEGATDYTLLKLTTTGTLVWNRTYGGTATDHLFGMDISADGSIFLTGHTLSGTQNWDSYTVKINQNGEQQWDATHGNPRGFDPQYIHDEVWDIKATTDGGAIIVAGTGDEYESYSVCNDAGACSDTWAVYLVKFNANGSVDWQQTYADPNGGSWAGEAISLTNDGGAMVAIDNTQFGFLKIAPF